MTTSVKEKSKPINIRVSKVYNAILEAKMAGKRRILLEGGTYSTKTYSALQALIVFAQKSPIPLDISVVSESIPHLKQGCIRDFFNILEESSENNPYYNKTDHIYRRPGWNGVFQFFGADDSGKVRGPRRHILFMNEGNNIPWETARGLDSRTEIFTIVDWNPVSEFWAHDYWIGSSENAYDHSTYEDALESGVVSPQLIKDNVEIYRDKDPNWWRIYGQGLIGKIENLVHPYFEQVDALPEGFTVYGLDWGFASDPTVLVKNVIIGDKLYSRQLLWDKSGLTNDQIAREMELLLIGPNDPIYADPNEPKSIAEIKQKRFNIMEAVKGPGSVAFGIQRVNQFYQYWTKDSVECIKEQRNFRYIKRMVQGREELTDDTTHQWSHGMSARRYAVASFRQNVGNKPKSKHGVAI